MWPRYSPLLKPFSLQGKGLRRTAMQSACAYATLRHVDAGG
jgi:hypothetical protein